MIAVGVLSGLVGAFVGWLVGAVMGWIYGREDLTDEARRAAKIRSALRGG